MMSSAETSTMDPTSGPTAAVPQVYGDPEGEDGLLLTLPEPQACARALKLFQSHNPIMKPVIEQWRLNDLLRRGITGAKLIQDPATGQWRARPPTKVTVNAEFINKAASLCRKLGGVLTADPPAPQAEPGEGDGDDPSSAEFTTRALIHVDSERHAEERLDEALDLSFTCSTVFERFFFNPSGNGRVPLEIEAGYDPVTGEEAQGVFDAEFQVITDEMTGEPIGQRAWRKRRQRFVRPDGTLTDDKAEAATRWQGLIESEILRGNNVRLYPHTARSVKEAHGVGILAFVAWGTVKSLFAKEVAAIPKELKDRIFNWKQEWADDALPPGVDRRQIEKARAENNEDEYLVPVLTTYFDGKRCPGDYPRGVYMVQLADAVALTRSTWEYEDVEGLKRPMSIPLSQLTLFREGRAGWPGVALMEILGPGNEARAAQIGSLLEYLDRLSSVKTLIPTSSIINPVEFGDRTKRFITYNPEGGSPSVEQLPPYPAAAAEMFGTLTAELNDMSGLQESGQGLEASTVKSGVQAMTILSQVQAALSPQARAISAFCVRGWKIELEMIRAYYTRPRRIKWVGEDGRHKEQAWSRADLGSSTDVKLDPSTMSMLRPAQKALITRELAQMGVLPPEEFQLATERNLGGTLALRDNPFRQRIRRQIEDWKAGPPEGWTPPPPMMQPMQTPMMDPESGMMQMDPATGGPMMQMQMDPATGMPMEEPMMDPMTGIPRYDMMQDPVARELWMPVPSDTLPTVAPLRLMELARLTATVAYERQPPEWRAQVEAEFERMQGAVQLAGQPMQDPSGPPAGSPMMAA